MVESDICYTPKTVDALFFKKVDKKFKIYLFEFKGDKLENVDSKYNFKHYIRDLEHKYRKSDSYTEKQFYKQHLNRIKPIYNKYFDNLLFDLILKPLETVAVSLPLIYNNYCSISNKNADFDIVNFLRETDIIYKVIYISESENTSKNRINANRLGNMGSDSSNDSEKTYIEKLNNYYLRYAKAKILNNKNLEFYMSNSSFNNYINNTLK